MTASPDISPEALTAVSLICVPAILIAGIAILMIRAINKAYCIAPLKWDTKCNRSFRAHES